MARIELPDGDGLEVARALRLAPQFAEPVVAQERAVERTTLPPRLHELVRYRIALLNSCATCLAFRRHESGVSEQELAEVASAATSDAFTAAEKAALAFAESFCTDHLSLTDERLAGLGRHFTPAELVELTLVVAKYLAMGRFMQVLGLDQACAIDHERLRRLS